MDSLTVQKIASTTSSNVTADVTNAKTISGGPSMPSYQKMRDENSGTKRGATPRGNMGGSLNFKSPLTICALGGPRNNGSSNGLAPNSSTSPSPNNYQLSTPFSSGDTPLISGYGLKPEQGTTTLNTLSNVDTAGTAGGGDAPYLGASVFNPFKGSSLRLCHLSHCLNDFFRDVDPVAAVEDNATAYQNLTDNRHHLTGVDAIATGVPEITNTAVYSRKVFVGGLPPDINEEGITNAFRSFGPLVIDWPHKITSQSEYPPKGYAFLIFQDESSVQHLIESCITDQQKLYLNVSSPGIKDKPVEIRPWRLSDASYILDATVPLDNRKTLFIGGVPRPLKAYELATIMHRLYGGVCYAGIDTDPELKYPKGAARVAFSNKHSYIAALSARFLQLQHGDFDKRVEVKPYVLGNQMCDECLGQFCGGKYAPFFCTNITCLKYFCGYCWAVVHSRPGREYHKPYVKEAGARSRTRSRASLPFRRY